MRCAGYRLHGTHCAWREKKEVVLPPLYLLLGLLTLLMLLQLWSSSPIHSHPIPISHARLSDNTQWLYSY